MKVGILSDTHDHFANMVYVLELFKQEEVGKILHAGDIASPTGAMALDSIAKRLGIQADIVAVFGNNDGDACASRISRAFPVMV